ncbi:hypothetical protein [Vibrio alfacsensis]|uniref:hypothetical protein n=1 Tax=Vibrio alfacsensis TaxID=1074311 RepID=UPI0040676058
MIIHETSHHLPKNSTYALFISLLSLSYFAYVADWLIELSFVMLVILLLRLISQPLERPAFNPKTIDVDPNSNTFKYRQGSTVYFRVPLDEITKLRIQKEHFYGNGLILYTANDSYQVPNSDNFDQQQLEELIKTLEEKVNAGDNSNPN